MTKDPPTTSDKIARGCRPACVGPENTSQTSYVLVFSYVA